MEQPLICGGKYVLLNETLGTGSFGQVVAGYCRRTRRPVAVKCALSDSPSALSLKHEFAVYQWLRKQQPGSSSSSSSSFPFSVVRYFHQTPNAVTLYLVLDQYGPSLHTWILQHTSLLDRWFFHRLAKQMLETLEILHQTGLLHRDLKPSNFLFRTSSSEELVLIDFGMTRTWRNQQGEHIPFREPTASLVGSINYASVHAHRRQELSRRDDLESLVYILLFLAGHGKLPWDTLPTEEMVQQRKEKLSKEEMERLLVPEIFQMLDYVRHLSFVEAPSYRLMQRRLLSSR